MSTTVLEKPPSLQDLTPELVAALKAQSLAAYDAHVKSRETLVSQNPDLAASLDQSVQPGSKCGCGCQQTVAGFFNFKGCGCGCAPHPETVTITALPVSIGPGAPGQGTAATFYGYAAGSGSDIDLSGVSLLGTAPDTDNLIGVQLDLDLSIGSGTLSLTLREGSRVLAVLVYPKNYPPLAGTFTGSGRGAFTAA